MPRATSTGRSRLVVLVAAAGLLAACGGGASDGAASDDDQDHEITTGECDPIRGAGTITNRAGEPAAFRVTVAYDYASEDVPALQSASTPVLADGESFEFSVGPDPTRGSPSSCRITGAERVEADAAAVEEVVERDEAAPDAEESAASLAPLWTVEGIGGSIQTVAADGSIGFMASRLEQGGAIVALELATGGLVWEIESDLRYEQLIPDGRGGVLATSGNVLAAFDETGSQTWQVVALQRAEGVPAGEIDHVALDGDVVIVGGQAPGAAAGIDLGSGEQRWHLSADEPNGADSIGFSGGGDLVAPTDHGVLVSGGVPSLRHLTLLDVSGGAPEVRWSLPDVGTNASTDGAVVVDAAGDTVTAWDVDTGQERWSVTNADWDRAPVAGAPAIVDQVVVVQRANSTIAFDLVTGDQVWESVDMPAYWAFMGSHVRYDDRVFGHVSLGQFVLLGADGALTDITIDADIRGTLSGAAEDGGLVLIAARGSTPAQGSTARVLDLGAVG